MFQPSVSISKTSAPCSAESVDVRKMSSLAGPSAARNLLDGIQRRWQRRLRRRRVGRAYDMALEIARVLPANSRALDVGCGNGFIAHHLSALLRADVIGIDVGETSEGASHYQQFDGKHFPIADRSMDAVLLCYVLHHAQDLHTVMNELQRVLCAGGQAIVYEDIPSVWWDRLICWTHNLKWRKRTGPCTFRGEPEWRALFNSAGFDIVSERPISRWRNLTHPVCHRFYVLESTSARLPGS